MSAAARDNNELTNNPMSSEERDTAEIETPTDTSVKLNSIGEDSSGGCVTARTVSLLGL